MCRGAARGSFPEDEAGQERLRSGLGRGAERQKLRSLLFGETRRTRAVTSNARAALATAVGSWELGVSDGPGESLLPPLGAPPGRGLLEATSACSLRCWESPSKQAPGPKGRPVAKLTKSHPKAVSPSLAERGPWEQAAHKNLPFLLTPRPRPPRPRAPRGQQVRTDMIRYLLSRSVQPARGQGSETGGARAEHRAWLLEGGR